METKQRKPQNQENQLVIESIRISLWTSINYDQTILALQEVVRGIIRHRIPSLSTVLGTKLNLPQFSLFFLQMMHDSPFNSQIQAIKLCFQFFQQHQIQKLNTCLQTAISSPSSKFLRQRQVLLNMCTIFTGLYVGDRQGALLYAKLNHHEKKLLILREQTLLLYVGSSYLNLAINEQYIINRNIFLNQANQAFKASLNINPNNYIILYNLAKISLITGDVEKAYKYSRDSLQSQRGDWILFSLLSCIYFCQRKVSKSTMLIDQLIKKYPKNKNLYYIRAYLQVNKLLLQVQHDEQVQASKQLGDKIYQITRQRALKGKSVKQLLRYCQLYHQLSVGMPITGQDQNYFTQSKNLSLSNSQAFNRTNIFNYKSQFQQKALFQIISLLIQARQIVIAQNLIKILPNSYNKTYYKALIYQNKGEMLSAINQYKAVINQQPFHHPSLLNLAYLTEDTGDALHYLNIAQKFCENNRLYFVKGIILSKMGRFQEANQIFIKQLQHGWLEFQPNILYFY